MNHYCKTVSIICFMLLVLITVAFAVAVFGAVLLDSIVITFGTTEGVIISAGIAIMAILVLSLQFVVTHMALLLWFPKKNEDMIFNVYQVAAVFLEILFICVGIIGNGIGVLNIILSVVYYGIFAIIPILMFTALGFRKHLNSETDKKEDLAFGEEVSTDLTLEPESIHGINCLYGEYKGAFFAMSDGEEMVIGKTTDICNILIHEEKISRKHCLVTYKKDMNVYYITDYSKNGTYLADGKRFPSGMTVVCEPSTIIYLGKGTQVFELV